MPKDALSTPGRGFSFLLVQLPGRSVYKAENQGPSLRMFVARYARYIDFADERRGQQFDGSLKHNRKRGG